MLYIVTALKSEAQAFVDKYKLTKSRYENFTIFKNTEMFVLISGVGSKNMEIATSKIIKEFTILDSDIFLNIGICGADEEYKIGELLEINSIIYNNKKFILSNNISNTITSVDYEVSDNCFSIVDMESFGFYQAVKEMKNCYIFKVVSDHFEPNRVTKERTKTLIFNKIEEIMKRVNR
jgi:nucleoside phosphorylase